MIAPRAGKGGAWPPTALLPLLIPLSFLYGMLASMHRALYAAGVLRRKTLPRPVVSVGNLTVGGGGKTPFVLWLANALRDRGVRSAILSRGYGRSNSEPRLVTADGSWKMVGDEPFLMASRLGDVPVAVAADRYEAGLEVLRYHDVDLFILDDGFQHHSLSRDLDILVVDDRRRFGSGRLLPAGLLREPVDRAKDAEFIVVTKANDVDTRFDNWLRELSGAPVLWTNLVARTPAPISPVENFPEGMVTGGPWLAFCGIADPESYRQTLDREGIDFIDLVVFPDHHPYLEKEASDLMDKARRAGANALLTTEKDAVRWPVIEGALPLHVLPVDLVSVKGERELLEAVLTLVEERGNGR